MEGFNARSRGDYRWAVECYTYAITLSPTPFHYLMRGTIYLEDLKQNAPGLNDMLKVIELDPEINDAYYYAASAFYNLGSYDNALIQLSRLLNQDPNAYKAIGLRGDALIGKARLESALESYENALKVWEGEGRPEVGFKQQLLGRIQQAAAKRISSNTKDPIGWALKGYVLLKEGRYDDALINFKRALDVRPTERSLHYYRSFAFNEKQQHKNALAEANMAFELSYQLPEFLSLRSDLQTRLASYGSGQSTDADLKVATRTPEDSKGIGMYPFTKTRPVTRQDLVGKDCKSLWIMRNEIYARYGVKFNDPEVKEHFLSQPWYLPSDSATYSDLTELEQQNAKTILEYEKPQKCLD